MPRTSPHSTGLASGCLLTAGLTLRFAGRRLDGHVYWPEANGADGCSPLVLVPTDAGADDADPLCRLLCAAAVVLAIPSVGASDDDTDLAALGWAGEHAAELGAHPQRLIVAGEGTGAARAAMLVIRARDDGWPRLRRQVLLYPRFTQTCPMPFLLTGVAPATVISSDTRIDDGSRYAARLRASEIEVDLLLHPPPILPGHDDLLAALARGNR